MGTDYHEFLNRGILEREQGNLKDAVSFLKVALHLTETKEEKINVRNHLGLTYFHQGDFTRAKGHWICVLECSKDDRGSYAVALRNLSRKELYSDMDGLCEAEKFAVQAFKLARLAKRKDMVWFAHGLFSARNAIGKKEDLKKILQVEAKEYFKVCWKVPKLERRVWFDGLIMDFAITYGKVTKPLLYLARMIAKVQNLKRREEQINKLIESLD